MAAQEPEFHRFVVRGRNILFDVGTLTMMEVDDLTYEVLDYYKRIPNEEIAHIFSSRYPLQDIIEVLEELAFLESRGLLQPRQEFSTSFSETGAIPLTSVTLLVANKCNLRCLYCFAGDGNYGYADEPFMSEEIAKRSIEFLLKNSGDNRVLGITFFGGEPLLNLKLIRFVVDLCQQYEKELNKEFRFSITTNGTLLIDAVREFLNARKFSVLISIDGSQPDHDLLRPYANGKGSWAAIAPKVESFVRSRQGNAMVRLTVTSKNAHITREIPALAELGFNRVAFAPVDSEKDKSLNLSRRDYEILLGEFRALAGKYLENLEEKKVGIEFKNLTNLLLDLHRGRKRRLACGVALKMVAIDPKGNIYPCHRYVGMEAYKLGNVLETGLSQQARGDFLTLLTQSHKKCQACWVRHYCVGGCYHNLCDPRGSIDVRSETECRFIRAQYELAIGVYLEMVRNHPNVLKRFDERLRRDENNNREAHQNLQQHGDGA